MKKTITFLYILLFNFIKLPCQENAQDIHSLHTPLIFHSVNVITGEYCEAQTDMTTSGGVNFKLRRSYESLSNGKWDFNAPNLIHISEHSPKEEDFSHKKIHYEYDQQHRLKSLKIGNYVQLNIERSNEKTQECRISSQDSLETLYRFSQNSKLNGDSSWILDEVQSSQNPLIRYEYLQHPQLRSIQLKKRLLPEGRYLINEYYELGDNLLGEENITVGPSLRDQRLGKIKLQKEPLGVDQSPVISRRYVYGTSFTEVYDALGNKTIYRYTPHKRLLAIENYTGCKDQYKLYRKEKFYWDEHKIPGTSLLVSRSLQDGDGNIHVCRTFEYDLQGHLSKETLYGTLTGQSSSPIILDEKGFPIGNGVESYSKTYLYSAKEPFVLLSKKEDNGKRIRFLYQDETDLLVGKLIYDYQMICEREFYFYDEHRRLIKTICDDGTSENWQDHQGISQRQTTQITLRNQSPAYGAVEELKISYWNPQTRQDEILKTIHYSYDKHGKVINESIWNPTNELLSSITYLYDSKGRVTHKEQSNGPSVLTQYDENHNLISQKEEDKIIVNTYDFCNRLIKRETTSKGLKTTESYTYDYMGNLISTTDSFGNVTRHTYDEMCRRIKTEYPPILGYNDEAFIPVETFEYDIFDHLIKKTDPYGYVTETSYNIRGKPLSIRYPNEAEESFEYDLEGQLIKHLNKLFHRTTYRRDYLGQVVEAITTTDAGELLQHKSTRYQGRLVIESSEANGLQVKYQYDGLGHPIKVQKSSGGEEFTQEHAYNQQGQLIQTKYYPSQKPEDFYLTNFERDGQGQVTHTKVENAQGEIIQSLENPSKPSSEPQEEIRLNSAGKLVKCLITRDEEGYQTENFFDALGHLEKSCRKDPYGTVISLTEYRHDFHGHKIKEKQGNQTHLWFYGFDGQLLQKIESAGARKQKSTFYAYNRLGQKIQMVKPDGVTLHYFYSDRGLLDQQFSSDGTIDYAYEYNGENQLTAIHDRVSQNSSYRQYSATHHLIQETLANGLTFSSTYNIHGQRTSLICPDQSSITYQYQDGRLSQIDRLSVSGKKIYTYAYSKFDLKGRLEATQGLFESRYTWDPKGKCTEIDTPFFIQKIVYQNGKAVLIHTEDSLGQESIQYDYDLQGRLIQDQVQTYAYDAQHNRQNVDLQYNDLNQLVAVCTHQRKYDLNGNLIAYSSEKGETTLQYDALNRLIHVSQPDCSIWFEYDGYNRKMCKQVVSAEESHRLYYLYDGFNEIGMTDADRQILEFRVLGKGLGAEIGAAIYLEVGGESFVPIHDQRGSTVALVATDSQTCRESYRYDSLGKVSIYDADGNLVQASALGNPWLFNSKRWDLQLQWYDFGKRFYEPQVGRWTTPDPLGDFDGLHPYLFVHNDPINHLDFYGLFSVGNSSDSQADVGNFFWELNNFVKKNFSFEEQLKDDLEKTGSDLFGKIFLIMMGFYEEPMENGMYGYGEISDKVRITMINGMLNVRLDCLSSARLISQSHGYTNVHYVFHPSDGYTKDLLKMVAIKLFDYTTPQARMLARTWKTLIAEMGGTGEGGMIYHYAHSYGGADTYIAQNLLTPEEQKMIKVVTFGTAKLIPNQGFHSVTNYVSRRDAVPGISDPFNYLRSLIHQTDHVVFLGSWWGVPFADHSLTTETYWMVLESLGKGFLEDYGY